MSNPYWAAVEHAVKDSEFPWEGPQVGRWRFDWHEGDPPILEREDYVHKYSWTITDPGAITFIRNVAFHGLVDPMAGTGYWAYVLAHVNVDVVCYDGMLPEENYWHKDMPQWVDIEHLDATLAVVKHPDRALLLAWPPYAETIGVRTINAYQGDKIVYIGEGHGGCTGNQAMFDVLDEEWRELAEYRPVQWWGVHDRITVYERKPREELAQILTGVRDNESLRTRTKRHGDVPRAD